MKNRIAQICLPCDSDTVSFVAGRTYCTLCGACISGEGINWCSCCEDRFNMMLRGGD